MAIFSDLELMGIMNEANKDDESSFDKFKDRVEDNIDKMKDTGEKMNNNLKNNLWINKHKQKKKTGKITFREDADGNIIDCIILFPISQLIKCNLRFQNVFIFLLRIYSYTVFITIWMLNINNTIINKVNIANICFVCFVP